MKKALLTLDEMDADTQHLVASINSILFRRSVPDKYGNDDAIQYREGDRLSFVRFLPTYLDRKFFYDAVFDRDANTNDNQVTTSNIPTAKRFFDGELAKYCNYEQIKAMYDKLLTQFKFVYVGIPKVEKANAQHCIYQWFFERELFIEQSGGDRPGYSQTVTDLFRNYVLSFFINEPMQKQQQVYEVWISVEKSYRNISELNAKIVAMVRRNKKQANIQSAEQQSLCMLKPYDLYRDLVKYIEAKLKKYEEDEYKVFIEEFIKRLFNQCERLQLGVVDKDDVLLIYGYLRGFCVVKKEVEIENAVIELVHVYWNDGHEMSVDANDDMLQFVECVDSEMSGKPNVIKF